MACDELESQLECSNALCSAVLRQSQYLENPTISLLDINQKQMV